MEEVWLDPTQSTPTPTNERKVTMSLKRDPNSMAGKMLDYIKTHPRSPELEFQTYIGCGMGRTATT
jgi:hypothetical protein